MLALKPLPTPKPSPMRLLLLALSLLLGGAAPTARALPKNTKASSNKTRFEQVAIQKNSQHCKSSFRIQIHSLQLLEAPSALKPLVETQLHRWLRWGLEAETSASTLPEAWAQEELERYERQECEAELQNAPTPWERTLTASHFFEDERWLVLSFEVVAFEGGAHESRQKQFVTWDKETYTPLTLAAFAPEPEALLKVAEAEFRKARKLGAEEEWEAHGYWFEKGQFRLSEQFALTECGLLLYYNTYEVAAYAQGPIEVLIPLDNLKALTPLPLPSKPWAKAFAHCPYALPPPPPAPKTTPKPTNKTTAKTTAKTAPKTAPKPTPKTVPKPGAATTPKPMP